MVGDREVLVVGAGVSGLACARALAVTGRPLAILERASGVGGRCATRRVEGQPVDLGPAFLHGRAPAFLAALEVVPAARLAGWPSDIHGTGRPCQPEAFDPGERRVAFAEGLTAFPKWLATGLEVRTGLDVTGLGIAGPRLRVLAADGASWEAGTVVLALAPEQALRMLDAATGAGGLPVTAPAVAATLRALLTMTRSEPSLALAALYPPDAPVPAWQVSYPEDSRILQVVSHDSSKRVSPSFRALVFQTHPRWSGEHLDDEGWPGRVLEEAGRVVGAWAATPLHRHAHRWRFARTGRAGEMSAPLLFRLPGGARLGVCGDRFAPGGGVEAAWLSGKVLARRILAEEDG